MNGRKEKNMNKKELYFTGFDCSKNCYFILKTPNYNINSWGYYETEKGTCKPNQAYETENDAINSLKKIAKPIIKLYRNGNLLESKEM